MCGRLWVFEKCGYFVARMDTMVAQLPKGMQDFHGEVLAKRRYMIGVIEKYFARYGYGALETAAVELLTTLQGKYGEEGEQLLFKILNGGKFWEKLPQGGRITSSEAVRHIAKRGLRYDLTIPLARFVVQHRHTLSFPFKRSQIQPVWRADRPQKGRFREFYQCDIDVIGSPSRFYEAEMLTLVGEVLEELGVTTYRPYTFRSFLSHHCLDHVPVYLWPCL